MSPAAEVLTFGEALGSLRSHGLVRMGADLSLSVAGAEANLAIALTRLGHTARWVGRVGDDELGQLALRTLRAEGVLVDPLLDPARPTGLMLLERRTAQVSRVAYYRAGSAGSALTAADVGPWLTGPDRPRLLHATGVTPALSPGAAEATAAVLTAARESGVGVSLAVNHRAALWSRDDARRALRPLAAAADVLFAAEEELALVAPDGADGEAEQVQALLGAGVGQVVVTRGGRGASAWTASASADCAARPVAVVDTVGAGDAFAAGYLSALLDGADLAGRLDRGVVLGAFAASAASDWEALPTRAELALLDAPEGSSLR